MTVKVFQGFDQPGLRCDDMIVFKVIEKILELKKCVTCLLV